jgi:hypothetical protein
MSEWQDIETYNKGITYKKILLADCSRVTSGHWSTLGWAAYDFNTCPVGWEPTHWQPLPAPPHPPTVGEGE